MDLPKGQDLVLDLTGWTGGPLPDQELEQVAFDLFRFKYPSIGFDNAHCKSERDECRRLAIRLRVKCLAMDRWTVDTAHERCAAELQSVIFGDRRLGPSIRREILDYCETFIADAWGHFGKRLFYERQVEANDRELEVEDLLDRR